jgi:protein involved in polysaccharide export with SLBB domain
MLLVAACRPTGQRLQAPGVVPGGVPPTPEHTLTAGDVFEIRLPFAADYNDRVTVGMDGTVAPKAIGSVQIGGLTVPEATERLKASYAKLLKAPDLSITVRRFAPEIIYVDGWVNRPGLIRSDIPLTLERALAQAGGVKTGAKTSDILIMRHDAGSTVRTYTAKAGPSLGGISGGPNLDDPLLKSFDVVYVPQTAVAAASSFAQQYYANVPFSASFHVPATQVPSIVTPQVINPPTPALPVIAPQ